MLTIKLTASSTSDFCFFSPIPVRLYWLSLSDLVSEGDPLGLWAGLGQRRHYRDRRSNTFPFKLLEF